MTYPPQPGQPDPYGQQQPPSSGGFPQQPYPQQGGWDPNQQQQQPYPTQQYPQGWDPNAQQQQQWDPNAQQQYAQQPYGQQPQQAWDPNAGGQMSGWDQNAGYSQGFGGPPAPPKKSKTGLIIALVAVVVVLAAVGITGFVAPGFFLSKDSTASGPDKTAADIVDALNRKDKNALNGLKCGDAEEDIAQIIDNVDKVSDVKLVGAVTKVNDTQATAIVSMKINGNPSTRKGTLGKSGENWCWREVGRADSTGGQTSSPKTTEPTETTEPTDSGGSGSANPAGSAVIKGFINKLNGNDKAGALALACPDRKDSINTWLTSLVKAPYELTVSGIDGENFISGDVAGKAGGKTVDGIMFAMSTDGKNFCVSSFLVS